MLESPRNFSRAIAIIAVGAATCAYAAGPSARLDGPSVVYASIDECHVAKLLTQAECHRAFANATAEFFEKAPRFGDRKACEAAFKTCSIAMPDGGGRAAGKARARGSGIDYVPRFTKVKIIVVAQNRKEVVPVLEGGPAPVRFQPRDVASENTTISPERAVAAKAAWRSATEKPKAPRYTPVAGGRPGPTRSEPEAEPDVDDTKPVESFPVSGARWQNMRERMRRNDGSAEKTR